MLIYAVYNGGKPLCDCQGDIVTFKRHVEKVTFLCFFNSLMEFDVLTQHLVTIRPQQLLEQLQYQQMQKILKQIIFEQNRLW